MLLVRMRALPLALILGTVDAICVGQVGIGGGRINPVAPQQQSAKRYSITGSVLNSVTGEPVRRALVQIGPSSAFTGPDGHFQLDDVPEGLYSASVQRPGFFDPTQVPAAAPPSMFTVGPNTPPLALKLIPESVIEGRVLSNTREPVENASVQVIGEQIFSGRKMLQVMAGINTDDAGEFRAEGLRPGKYYVQIMQHPVYGWGFEGNRQVYPEEFYPNAPDLASAQAVQLKGGETAQVDFTVSPQIAFRVSGVLTPASPNGLFVTLQDSTGQETRANMGFDSRGKWILPLVPPGSWNLVFREQGKSGETYYAEQRIEVHGSDIEKLAVVLQSVPPIPVQVVNAPEGNAQAVQLRLIPQGGPRLNSQEYMAQPEGGNPAGALSVQNVPPGTYRVAVQSNGPGCIDSISSGSLDLMRDALVVAPGSAPAVQVALRNDCASLDVTVQSQNRTVAQPILVLPESPALDPKIAFAPGGSHAQLSGLTPGNYRLYAVPNLNNLEYTNPEAMRDLESQEITLAPNQQASVTINALAGAANE